MTGSYELADILVWVVSGSYIIAGVLFAIAAKSEEERITVSTTTSSQ